MGCVCERVTNHWDCSGDDMKKKGFFFCNISSSEFLFSNAEMVSGRDTRKYSTVWISEYTGGRLLLYRAGAVIIVGETGNLSASVSEDTRQLLYRKDISAVMGSSYGESRRVLSVSERNL